MAFIAGIAAGSGALFSWGAILAIFLLGVIFIVFSSAGRQILLLLAIILLFFAFGFARALLSPVFLPEDLGGALAGTRSGLVERSAEVIGGEEHAMFSAMVLGDKSLLSNETKDNFSLTGTRHILAISGMHLAIVAVVVWQILISLGLWRRQAFWGSLLAIAIFVLLVGMPPSAVRAGIMAGGPYKCAFGNALYALYTCMATTMGNPDVSLSISTTKDSYSSGDVDDPKYMKNDKVWLYHGTNDQVVHTKVMDDLNTYYKAFVNHDNTINWCQNSLPLWWTSF